MLGKWCEWCAMLAMQPLPRAENPCIREKKKKYSAGSEAFSLPLDAIVSDLRPSTSLVICFFLMAWPGALHASQVGGFRPVTAIKVGSIGRLTIATVFDWEQQMELGWKLPGHVLSPSCQGSSREEMDIKAAGPPLRPGRSLITHGWDRFRTQTSPTQL